MLQGKYEICDQSPSEHDNDVRLTDIIGTPRDFNNLKDVEMIESRIDFSANTFDLKKAKGGVKSGFTRSTFTQAAN